MSNFTFAAEPLEEKHMSNFTFAAEGLGQLATILKKLGFQKTSERTPELAALWYAGGERAGEFTGMIWCPEMTLEFFAVMLEIIAFKPEVLEFLMPIYVEQKDERPAYGIIGRDATKDLLPYFA
jgi:hypothetical protein